MYIRETELLHHLSKLKEVISVGDIRVLFPKAGEDAIMKFLKKMCDQDVLFKVKAGLYASKKSTLPAISLKINHEAYLSFDHVLSKYGLLGTIPERRLRAIKVGFPRQYSCPLGFIDHMTIAKKYYFGFRIVEGQREATPEKAFLDSCYYGYKGQNLGFELHGQLAIGDLDMLLIKEYLEVYTVPFVKHCERLMDELK